MLVYLVVAGRVLEKSFLKDFFPKREYLDEKEYKCWEPRACWGEKAFLKEKAVTL